MIAISTVLALFSTIILYTNIKIRLVNLFPVAIPYIENCFLYGWIFTIALILTLTLRRMYRSIFKIIIDISKLLIGITSFVFRKREKLSASEIKTEEKGQKLRRAFSWISSMKADKGFNKLQSNKKESKMKDPFIVSIDVLPKNKQNSKTESIGKSKYQAMVKKAFIRVGAMNEEQLKSVRVYNVLEGPQAMLINISLPEGYTVSKLKSTTEDLRHAFDAPSFQIEAAKAGKVNLIIFRKKRKTVLLRDLLENPNVIKAISSYKLPVVVGLSPIGEPIFMDLVDAPHLLVAGATKSGKSWWLNQLLFVLLMVLSPDELSIWIVDPKVVEFGQFKGVPHVERVETDVEASVKLFRNLVIEMENRYRFLHKHQCKNIDHYNLKYPNNKMKYIVVMVDELADLIVQDRKNIIEAIMRLAQKARAAGIHLVNATQRPSAKIIDGDIKANLPSRIVFRLKTQADYSTVLDRDPKTNLMGFGDGIADIEGYFGYKRFQSPGVGPSDIEFEKALEKLIDFWNGKNKKIDDIENINDPKIDEKDIVFSHGHGQKSKSCEEKPKVVPAGKIAEGTTFIRQKNDTDKDEENEDQNKEVDPEAYIRLEILKSFLTTIKQNDDENDIFAPSSNELSKSLGIRKATIIEHYKDLQKEEIIEKHPSRRYVIKSNENELSDMIVNFEDYFEFVAE
ncbi:FtsK/SpoIIIE domain-containing protein [Maledivibacter halophilus]|uniref:FtsK/SpoIIIE family protein n=1 Tax=Maledivibacter halophilus TaxID=36842 RepID=A0A1T5MQS2_9FIRM|nr:FtsK/SpoIIIE domain-containing protein [Maledivibacter halophilus]SKC90565.1 FtsK/SpoIIIE family protein [Maledivibacter halophilus]